MFFVSCVSLANSFNSSSSTSYLYQDSNNAHYNLPRPAAAPDRRKPGKKPPFFTFKNCSKKTARKKTSKIAKHLWGAPNAFSQACNIETIISVVIERMHHVNFNTAAIHYACAVPRQGY